MHAQVRCLCHTPAADDDTGTAGRLEALADVDRLLPIGSRQANLEEGRLTEATVDRAHDDRRPDNDPWVLPLDCVKAYQSPVKGKASGYLYTPWRRGAF